jgi:hypothetical protein
MSGTMAERFALDNQTLIRRTLVSVGAMVGACVVVVGTLTLVVSLVVGHAVGPRDEPGAGGGIPAANVHGVVPGAKPPPAPAGAK